MADQELSQDHIQSVLNILKTPGTNERRPVSADDSLSPEDYGQTSRKVQRELRECPSRAEDGHTEVPPPLAGASALWSSSQGYPSTAGVGQSRPVHDPSHFGPHFSANMYPHGLAHAPFPEKEDDYVQRSLSFDDEDKHGSVARQAGQNIAPPVARPMPVHRAPDRAYIEHMQIMGMRSQLGNLSLGNGRAPPAAPYVNGMSGGMHLPHPHSKQQQVMPPPMPPTGPAPIANSGSVGGYDAMPQSYLSQRRDPRRGAPQPVMPAYTREGGGDRMKGPLHVPAHPTMMRREAWDAPRQDTEQLYHPRVRDSPPRHRRSRSDRSQQGSSSDYHNSSEGSDGGGSDAAKGEESEEARNEFKEFAQKLKKAKSEQGYSEAMKVASSYLQREDAPLKWKVYLELADIAKKDMIIDDARGFFKQACESNPHVTQAWIEYIKMEEEYGEMKLCKQILKEALENCPNNDTLVMKALRLLERIGDFHSARAILAGLRSNPDKNWRVLLEGAYMEARLLNVDAARKITQWLISKVTTYGPLFSEVSKFEEKQGNIVEAIRIASQGLKNLPRYGPLWFSMMRLLEKGDVHEVTNPITGKQVTLYDIRSTAEAALSTVTKELEWKVYYYMSQVEARHDKVETARRFLYSCATKVPPNLRWKVWLGGARIELVYLASTADRRSLTQMLGSDVEMEPHALTISRALLTKALGEVGSKISYLVLLECARTEEFFGQLHRARQIHRSGKKEYPKEWKLWFESALLEIRDGDKEAAEKMLVEATSLHPGTGRLWALLIQCVAPSQKLSTFKQALREVPKSGEVWCEGARLYMDPLLPYFDLETAERYLKYAVQFTPQYGDSFIELIRLSFLKNGGMADVSLIAQQCYSADPNYGVMWFRCKSYPYEGPAEVMRRGRTFISKELKDHRYLYQRRVLGVVEVSDSSLDRAKDCYARDREINGYCGYPMLMKSCTSWDLRASSIFGPDPIST
mmetsp:Transcript_34411/g.89051  ORF Transcript_34411/g.89051 Transcript_34411/m.89051 type:complete len:972 (-) Transcript_34411:547-3462(-)